MTMDSSSAHAPPEVPPFGFVRRVVVAMSAAGTGLEPRSRRRPRRSRQQSSSVRPLHDARAQLPAQQEAAVHEGETCSGTPLLPREGSSSETFCCSAPNSAAASEFPVVLHRTNVVRHCTCLLLLLRKALARRLETHQNISSAMLLCRRSVNDLLRKRQFCPPMGHRPRAQRTVRSRQLAEGLLTTTVGESVSDAERRLRRVVARADS